MSDRPLILWSSRNRRILWTFRILVGGTIGMVTVTGAALVWFFYTELE